MSKILSGLLLLNDTTLLAGISLRDLHNQGNLLIGGFTLLHILAVFSHDLEGTGSDVSAMINGHKTFPITPAQSSKPGEAQSVALDDLVKGISRRDD